MKMPESYDSRFIRFLAAVLTPGAVAAWPWIVALGLSQPDVGRWLMQASALPYTVILVVTLVAGLLLEDAGSRLECWLERTHLHQEAWIAYLLSKRDDRIVNGYISSVVTRFKFELAMPFALVIGVSGIGVIHVWQGVLAAHVALPIIVISLATSLWLVFEARETSRLLDNIRRAIFFEALESKTSKSGSNH